MWAMHQFRATRAIFISFVTFVLVEISGPAALARVEYNLKADAIFAEHTTEPSNPASERAILFAEAKYKVDRRW